MEHLHGTGCLSRKYAGITDIRTPCTSPVAGHSWSEFLGLPDSLGIQEGQRCSSSKYNLGSSSVDIMLEMPCMLRHAEMQEEREPEKGREHTYFAE